MILFIITQKMKKTLLVSALICSLFVFWCSKHWGQNNWFFYDNTLTIEWVFENVENYEMGNKWTLVLNWYFEDHVDHIYINKWMRENYFKSESEYLPWNTVKFMWSIVQIDAWAWNHYYNVESIDRLEVAWYPNIEWIQSVIEKYKYCESDDDCSAFSPWCPIWCYISVNKWYLDISQKITDNYLHQNGSTCVYDCQKHEWVVCEENRCTVLTEKPLIPCTTWDSEECTNEFDPVCWNNWIWYFNSCLACSNKRVNSYSIWWCKELSFFLSWDPTNLEYVKWFLENNWSLTCNMTYTFKWETLKWKFIADNERFYWIRDIYYDGGIYHNYEVLSLDWKRYEWIRGVPDINISYWFTYPVLDDIILSLKAVEIFSDFNIECQAWIDDEDLLNVPSDIKFN